MPPVKFAVVSDIHGNLAAFEAVLEDIRDKGIERIICLGDLIGYQRPEVKRHIKDIADYINSRDVVFPNSIILAFDSRVTFRQSRGPKVGDGVGEAGVLRFLERACPDYLIVFPAWFPTLTAMRERFTPVERVRLSHNTVSGAEEMVVYETEWSRGHPAPRACEGGG